MKKPLIILLLLFYWPVWAVEMTDLYQAKVPVSSQSVIERKQAIAQALQKVLLKVGGRLDLMSNTAFKTVIKNSERYLESYRFELAQQQQFLIASFNEAKVNQLFIDNDLPIWGNLRPQILVWLIQEQGLTRRLIGESDDSVIPQLIKDISQEKGLPIRLPLLDLKDRQQVIKSDIWGRFAEPIHQYSSRYHAEASVIIRISDNTLLNQHNSDENPSCGNLCNTDNLALDWALLTEQSYFSPVVYGADKLTLLTQALTQITNKIYQSYVSTFSAQQTLTIEVLNLADLKDYVAASEFLQGLSSVNQVVLTQAQGAKRRFVLQLIGSADSLLSSLKLNKQLQQYQDPFANIDDNIPQFYWRGE